MSTPGAGWTRVRRGMARKSEWEGYSVGGDGALFVGEV